jgi:heme/copper-type cytochrome/quinol oxidase subunit 3
MSTTPAMEAMTPVEVAEAARRRAAKPNGWWGMLIFIATEATLFAVFIAAYSYLRFKSVEWPPPSAAQPQPLVPSILTAVLVTTSIPMQMASSAAIRGRLRATRTCLFLALFIGSGYLAMQLYRFVTQVRAYPPSADAYDSILHTLSGGHHVHVFIALLLNAWLLIRLTRGITNYRAIGVQAAALYWHFVNVLAVVVLLTVQSPSIA